MGFGNSGDNIAGPPPSRIPRDLFRIAPGYRFIWNKTRIFLRRPSVTRLLRYSCALAIALVCFSTVASADLKIKTRTTVMGHTSESTVYIKGARQRRDMSFGGHGGSVSIIQCDQK